MKKIITFVLFVFCANCLTAQFGINAGFRSNGENKWEKYFPNQDFLKSGYKVGIDYWFRLKNKRVEFTPELAFSQFTSENIYSEILPPLDVVSVKSQIYSLYLNTNIYFLDLANDCNCPTWSKQSDFFKKGIFIQLSPGFNYFQYSLKNYQGHIEKANDFVFSLGVGLGLDIGISNMITFTPMVAYHQYFNATWDGLSKSSITGIEIKDASESTNLGQFHVGLRIGVRLDQQNYGFR